VYVSECGSKNGSRGISVARELKWDLCLEGKCNQASREPERAPLGASGLSVHAQADSAVCLGYSSRAQAVLRNAHPRLRLKRQLLTSKH
jgi:hypothetical protein